MTIDPQSTKSTFDESKYESFLKQTLYFRYFRCLASLMLLKVYTNEILRYYYIYNKHISHLCLLPSHTSTFTISAVQHSSKHLFALPKKIPQFRKTFFEIGLLLPLMHVNFT